MRPLGFPLLPPPQAHPAAAGPPADACRGKGREPGGDAAEEEQQLAAPPRSPQQQSISRCVRSPLPRLPSLRMDSGSWAGHDSQGSPAHPGSTAAGGPLTCAAREAVDAAAAGAGELHALAGPVLCAPARRLVLRGPAQPAAAPQVHRFVFGQLAHPAARPRPVPRCRSLPPAGGTAHGQRVAPQPNL